MAVFEEMKRDGRKGMSDDQTSRLRRAGKPVKASGLQAAGRNFMMRAFLIAPAVAALACASGANAADLPLPTEPALVAPVLAPAWEFTVAPYLWAAGIDGETKQFGLPAVDIDMKFK